MDLFVQYIYEIRHSCLLCRSLGELHLSHSLQYHSCTYIHPCLHNRRIGMYSHAYDSNQMRPVMQPSELHFLYGIRSHPLECFEFDLLTLLEVRCITHLKRPNVRYQYFLVFSKHDLTVIGGATLVDNTYPCDH